MSVKILLADDHQLFLDGLTAILKQEIGIEILGTVNNGYELLKLIEHGSKPDVVLSDVRMPIMDGIVVTRTLKKNFPQIPVIALTMFDQESDVHDMLEAGAMGYVIKKAEKKELVEAIHTVAKGQKYFSKQLAGIYEEWSRKDTDRLRKDLTRRERQILRLIIRGKTSLQMAEELRLSRFTIDTHRKNIHKKLGIKSNISLVKYADEWLNDTGELN